jgi:hypothetical protein
MPLAIVLSIWSYDVSVLQITIELLVALGLSAYIFILAILSPCPPLLGSWLGPFLSVSFWVLLSGIYMRVRCLIATRLQRFGQRALLTIGFLQQFGQICGGVVAFVLVNFYDIFKSKPECVDDFHLYCK